MKKLLILGVSACLLLTFSGSALAASTANVHNTKKSVHTAKTPKIVTVHKEKTPKNHQLHNKKHSNPKTHKKAIKTAPKK